MGKVLYQVTYVKWHNGQLPVLVPSLHVCKTVLTDTQADAARAVRDRVGAPLEILSIHFLGRVEIEA